MESIIPPRRDIVFFDFASGHTLLTEAPYIIRDARRGWHRVMAEKTIGRNTSHELLTFS